jgi:O-antigen ligase
LCIVALTLLAPALGGTTQLWAKATMMLGTGLLLLAAPPKRSLGWLPNLGFFALAALGAASCFALPVKDFPPWRTTLLNQFGLSLGGMRSAQPWISFEAACLLVLGLVWARYLLAFEWTAPQRIRAVQQYCIGVLLLAAAVVIAFTMEQRVPFWPDAPRFGFFPNRNQTSNVLGLAGVMIYTLGFESAHRKPRSIAWFLSLGLICWALIATGSRAGFVLFGLGAGGWYAWSCAFSGRVAWVGAGAAIVLLLVTLFLLTGGDMLTRFTAETSEFLSLSRNYRIAIFRDALDLTKQAPWLGIGLGNFEAVFPVTRQFSIAQNSVIHPESDWLWAAVEMGWLAPVVLLALIGWWMRQCFPFNAGSDRSVRSAALIAGCLFALHGLLDVSGHRIGALWPALFFASLAIQRPLKGASAWSQGVFRGIGLGLMVIGMWWFGSIARFDAPSTSVTWQRDSEEIDAAIDRSDYPKALEISSTRALAFAPLDWTLYYRRATAEATLSYSKVQAVRDFSIARYLQPHWTDLCLKEGQVWLGVEEPDLAFEAWQEALQRAGEAAPQIYGQLYQFVGSRLDLKEQWRELARGHADCELVYLGAADQLEFDIELRRILSEDPELSRFTPNQIGRLLGYWFEKGDHAWLSDSLTQSPQWKKAGYRTVAGLCAEAGDYEGAVATVRQSAALPAIPVAAGSIPALQRRFLLDPKDSAAGLGLFQAQFHSGLNDDALATLRKVKELGARENYLSVAEADLWAQKKEWRLAWEALKTLKLD